MNFRFNLAWHTYENTHKYSESNNTERKKSKLERNTRKVNFFDHRKLNSEI